MKITRKTVGTAQGTRLLASAGERGDYFALLNLTAEEGLLSGYVGTAGGNALAIIRPVQFRGGLVNAETAPALCDWMLARSTGLKVHAAGSDAPASGLSGQASAWARFLDDKAGARPVRQHAADLVIELDGDSVHVLSRMGLVVTRQKDLTLRRHQAFRSGSAVSGFVALRVHAAAAAGLKAVAPPPDIDVMRAQEALAYVKRPSSHAVAWYGLREPERARLRGQAAASWPVLAGVIADTPSIARRVDAMESLVEALQERTGLGKAALKRISKLRAPLPDEPIFQEDEEVRGEDALGVNRLRRTALRGTVSMSGCLGVLSRMNADRTPQTDTDWKAFVTTLSGCAQPLANVLEIAPETILEASKGSWEGWREQLARAADFDPDAFGRRQLGLATIDALEAIEDFSRTVVLPLALRAITSADQPLPPQAPEYLRQSFSVSADIVLGKSKAIATNLLEIGRRYASRIPSLMAIDGLEPPDDNEAADLRWSHLAPGQFPALAEPWQASNGMVIRPLASHDLMREESARLNHCVGRLYLNKAIKMDCHLFSVQNADGQLSFSTIELDRIADDGRSKRLPETSR